MQNYHSLHKVKHRYAVSYRAQDRISIRSEYDIPLSIDSAAKVRELRGHVQFKWGEELGPCFTLKFAFITLVVRSRKENDHDTGVGRDLDGSKRPEIYKRNETSRTTEGASRNNGRGSGCEFNVQRLNYITGCCLLFARVRTVLREHFFVRSLSRSLSTDDDYGDGCRRV